jgi:ketosteroid isomerase-like protein
LHSTEEEPAGMRRILFLPLLAFACLASARLPAESRSEADVEQTRKEVLQVEQEMTQASAKADIEVLDRIFADDMVWTARGDVLNKSQVLSDFRSGNDSLSRPNHYDIHLHVYGNTVILTGRSTSIVRYKGKISKGPRLYTQVYIKLDGRWQLVSHQVTDVAAQ